MNYRYYFSQCASLTSVLFKSVLHEHASYPQLPNFPYLKDVGLVSEHNLVSHYSPDVADLSPFLFCPQSKIYQLLQKIFKAICVHVKVAELSP